MKKKIKRILLFLVVIAAIAVILEIFVFKNSFSEPVKTELKKSE